VSETSSPSLSFDRMRNMLMRAAEIRDSEQQQIFDSLDEIHARLATLDTLGSMRKRLSEVPDRTELRQLAHRLDEAVSKVDAQDGVLAALGRAVEAVTESLTAKLATPLAQLDGRLEGVTGRFEGVAGRMDGLEDRLSGLHKRLDDLDNRLDRHELRIDALPSAVSGPLRERFDGLDAAVKALQAAIGAGRETLDGRIDAVTTRLDEAAARLDAVSAPTERGWIVAGEISSDASGLLHVVREITAVVSQAERGAIRQALVRNQVAAAELHGVDA